MKNCNEVTEAATLRWPSHQEFTLASSTRILARRTPRWILTVGAAVCAGFAVVHAQNWETVDDVEAPSASASKVVADSAGNIFVSGSMRDETARYHAVVMRSTDGGTTWETSADYPALNDQSAPNGAAAAFQVLAAADVNGESQVVAAGYVKRDYSFGSLFSRQWLVVSSQDGGATWNTLDEYTHPPYPQPQSGLVYPTMGEPTGVAWDGSGNMYVVGIAREMIVTRRSTTAVDHWLIRKGVETGGGRVWSLVADIPYTVASDQEGFTGPKGVTCVGNHVYVVGNTGSGSWEVRKSIDGGATWPVENTFRLSPTGNTSASGIAADTLGNIFVIGTGAVTVTSGKGKTVTTVRRESWIVRQRAGSSTLWTTVDQFPLPGGNAKAYGVAVDANDDVHVTGTAWSGTSSTLRHWISRQRSATTGAWTTTDDFALSLTGYSEGKSISADPMGNLFAAGSAIDMAGQSSGWLVRRKLAPLAP